MTDTPTNTPQAEKLAAAVQQVDADKAAKDAAKVEKKATEQSTVRRGTYVVYDADDNVVTAYSAETNALRHAVSVKGSVQFRQYGEDFHDTTP